MQSEGSEYTQPVDLRRFMSGFPNSDDQAPSRCSCCEGEHWKYVWRGRLEGFAMIATGVIVWRIVMILSSFFPS